MNILCKLGLHSWYSNTTYFPSLYAKIVTRFVSHCECSRCGLVKHHKEYVWDGEDFNESTN